MAEIETDYLVVGAGATGMAFVDALVAQSPDVDVVIVDRRHGPGGHWLDAYPFVRLHQPSANYGVNSRLLGHDRIDESGPNAGFYERATAGEICDYYARVLSEDFVPSGRVRFFGLTDYRGSDGDGHHLTSLLTGAGTTVSVRRRVVDATYIESSIPSRHTPTFSVDPGVRLIPPNDLVDLDTPAAGFTVLGCGKTAMDTCNWLLDNGVDPDRIEWFRPRDPWLMNRAGVQPLELVHTYMRMMACWVAATAESANSTECLHRLEADGVFHRIDPEVEPAVFRGATISSGELESLRTIERIIPGRRVVHIGSERIVTDDGDRPTALNRVHVDCTAPGVRRTVPRPIFEGDRITLQHVTLGIVPWSAASVGVVEALDRDDAEKNLLCPPLPPMGEAKDFMHIAYVGMTGLMARMSDPDVNAWNDQTRLNPARGAGARFDDPRIAEAFVSLGSTMGPALANLGRVAGSVDTALV